MGGNNNTLQAPQQTMPQDISTTNGQPPMSMVGGGTNLAPNASSFTNVAPAQQMPQGLTMGGQQPINTEQMAQQAAAMPTARPLNADGTPVTDGMVNGKYNPQYDDYLNQTAGRMAAMQRSGAFLTPQQKFAGQHPILNALTGAAQGFAQGFTKQPFHTANQENQTALQNTSQQDATSLMSPTNVLNTMFLKQMMGQTGGGTAAAKPNMPNPYQMAQIISNAPKGATGYSPTIGYHDAQGNPIPVAGGQ